MQLSPTFALARALRAGAGRFAAALVLGAALCGCSAVKLTYDNAPTVGYWWLDSYVDFRDDQTPVVRARLAELLAWHRANELPTLVALLEDAARRAPDGVAPSEVCAVGDALRQRLVATARQAAAPTAELVAGLDDAQLQRLEEKFAKNNAAYAKDWLAPGPEKQHRKRYDKDLERFEDFYGRLDEAQRALLREFADRSVFDPRRVDAERRRRQREVLAWLRDPAHRAMPEAEMRAAIDTYARDFLQPAPGAWRDHQETLQQENCRKVAALHEATRPEQRERAARRLQAYAQDLRELAAAP
ncbi:DUF6279 family lipoprotein [Variovorax sp. PvP013]|uniref:DUF6279 family lipoprotein n=1 Tax=Variovorax sp. PvP013 TaxID=3156435 RepID=UPI003D202120